MTQPAIACYAQGEEDLIIASLLDQHGMPRDTGTFVEIGVGDGEQNNTRSLAERGWQGTWIGNEALVYKPTLVTFQLAQVELDNLQTLVLPYDHGCDLFSLDIDGNDYWVGQVAIPFLDPKIIVVEYCHIAPVGWIMPYAQGFRWHRGMLCGASLQAWVDLLSADYDLVYTTRAQVNAIFVKKAVLSSLATVGGRDDV